MAPSVEYVELHCHSHYSFLDGASSPETLVARAASLGHPALALTDHNGLYGAVRFWHAARDYPVRPIIGAEVTVADQSSSPPQKDRKQHAPAGHHLTLLAATQDGYTNLCRLISASQLAGQKSQPHLTWQMLADHTEGLLCLSGCRAGIVAAPLLAGDKAEASAAASRLRKLFGPDNFWIELQHHYLPSDAWLTAELAQLAHCLNLPIVATNNVHHAERAGQRLHDVLICIGHLTTLPEALGSGLLHPNSERFLKSAQEMAILFAELPEAVRNTLAIAERCQVSLDFSSQRLPTFPAPQGHTLESYLRALCREGLRRKFDPVTPRAQAQLDHELAVIERCGLSGYFLVVWDIVRFARSQSIRCQGRGSAANSLVAYVLDITPVDPLRHNLLFERFLAEGTHTMPDIDVDFAADRREEVIQYVYERYGEEHVAMVCNVVTYRARSALREVAKALAFPPDIIDRAAKALDTYSATEAAQQMQDSSTQKAGPTEASDLALGPSARARVTASPYTDDRTRSPASSDPVLSSFPWQTLADLLQEIDGTPRHLSIHVGGMLITAAPLVEVVPVERATMPGRVVVQWNKDSVEDAGLIKIDLLSLGTLGMVDEALQHIREQREIDLDLERLPLDLPEVYDMLQRADTVGTFQVESRAQTQMLPRLRPQCFEDIVIEVALVRPGPIQGNMVHPYLRRRSGLEPVTYVHPDLEPPLAETLGVIIFQEQVIRVAMSIAGFTPIEADQLRRAMSRCRSSEAMARLQDPFVAGAMANGVGRDTAEEIFHQLAGFAGFGFCKSHAAAFALVGYQTLYLKAHYPAEFFCALLNHQPMGFYAPEVLIGDARRHGVPVLHPDINISEDKCTLEEASALEQQEGRQDADEAKGPSLAIRLGLRYVHGLGEVGRTHIVERRGQQAYRNLQDFCRRTRLPRALVENLIRAGAMDSLTQTRRDLLWELGGLVYEEVGLDLDMPIERVTLPALKEAERLGWEYELLGMAPGDHIMRLYRDGLKEQSVLSSSQLATKEHGEMVRVAGMSVVRQRPPTAKGHVFITLEDEEGLMNLIIRPNVYKRYKDTLRNRPLLLVEGQLQKEGLAISVLVQSARPIR